MVDTDRNAAALMWADYQAAHPEVPDEPLVVETFGDSPELADELLAFVIRGTKRATAGLVADFAAEGEPLPRIGSHWIVCDGAGSPRAIVRNYELRLGPLSSVDEQFAWDEGEYDRTLATWLKGHRRYFTRRCQELGTEFSDDVQVCFERFRLVWPPEISDATAQPPAMPS